MLHFSGAYRWSDFSSEIPEKSSTASFPLIRQLFDDVAARDPVDVLEIVGRGFGALRNADHCREFYLRSVRGTAVHPAGGPAMWQVET
jgi:hypothetical protein